MVESIFRRFYMMHHAMINGLYVWALIYATAEVHVNVKRVVPHASIADCLTTPMYTVTLGKIGNAFDDDSMDVIWSWRGQHGCRRLPHSNARACWMSTSAAQHLGMVLAHTHTEPTPVVSC